MTRLVWTLPDGESTARWAPDEGGGDGSSPFRIERIPFAFDTDDILTGADIYTPAVGEAIMPGSYIRITAAFDGTDPTLWVTSPGWTFGAAELIIADATIEDEEALPDSGWVYPTDGSSRWDGVAIANDTTPLALFLGQSSDGSDPESTEGEGEVVLIVAVAP